MSITEDARPGVDDELLAVLQNFEPDPEYPTFEASPDVIMPESVFASARKGVWKNTFKVRIAVADLVGGTPSNSRVAEGWLRRRLHGSDAVLSEQVAKTMLETGFDLKEAENKVISDQGGTLNVFKRLPSGALTIEGRQVKAALKESFSVAMTSGHFGDDKKFGVGNFAKSLKGFVPEHVMVEEKWVPLLHEDGTPFTEPSRVQQRFVHTWRGSAITYEEVVDLAFLDYTILCDWDFKADVWPTVMVIAEQQGIGACRSQSFGKYAVVRFDKQ